MIGNRDNFFCSLSLPNSFTKRFYVFLYYIYPSLFVPCFYRRSVYFCTDSDASSYIPSLWLCSTHATKPRGYEYVSSWLFIYFSESIQYGNSGAVNNSLWTNVHVATCSHLSVLRYS